MGKQAREGRRQLERARRAAGPAAEVADRADQGLDALVAALARVAAVKGVRVRSLDLEGFDELRQTFIRRGYHWPSWCYLPAAMVGAGLGEDVAVDLNPSLLSPATMLATLGTAWVPGRIAVRFDDDVARALMDTPVESAIPVEVLQRLPAWGLYVDCPTLAPGAGFFVALDAGAVRAPDGSEQAEVDELLVAIVRPPEDGPPVLLCSQWLKPNASIGESLEAQAQQRDRLGAVGLEAGDEEWIQALGMSRAEVTARLLSLVLYLCADDTDVTRREVPAANPVRGPSRRRDTTVLSAGFRLGAALRSAAAAHGQHQGEGSGQRVAPHLRRAHWHHYWAGSEARQNRHLKLHWVAPISVNADLRDELLTVVRPAGRP
jgi:hypothetical protein